MSNRLVELYKKFKSTDSDGGRTITESEQAELSETSLEQMSRVPVSDTTLANLDIDIDKSRLQEIRKAYLQHPAEYKKIKGELNPSKNFWTNTAFGRTLSGRNKAGRVVRRVGGIAGAIGGSLLGVDLGILGGAVDAGAEGIAILDQIETILLILAGIVGMICGGADYAEIRGERLDDREILEGVEPAIRKLTRKLKNI